MWILLFSYLSGGDGYLLEGLEINPTRIHILSGKTSLPLVTNLENSGPDLEKPQSLG